MGSDMGSGMGSGMSSAWLGYHDIAITMLSLLVITLGIAQINAQHGDMGGGMGSDMGTGMASGMGMDCCPKKKIWGSMNQNMDGMYVNVGKMPWGKLPMRCNSDCVYER